MTRCIHGTEWPDGLVFKVNALVKTRLGRQMEGKKCVMAQNPPLTLRIASLRGFHRRV